MSGTKLRMPWTTPIRLTSRIHFQSLKPLSHKYPPPPAPPGQGFARRQTEMEPVHDGVDQRRLRSSHRLAVDEEDGAAVHHRPGREGQLVRIARRDGAVPLTDGDLFHQGRVDHLRRRG